MKNRFKEIKQAIEYGHIVEIRDLKSKQYCVCSFTQDDGNIVIISAWRSKKEEAYDLLGYSLLEKYEVDELDLEIKIIPHRYKELPVGSLVDIIDCEELREIMNSCLNYRKDFTVLEGLEIERYINNYYGQSYNIHTKDKKACYIFPANFITPHIEEEKRDTVRVYGSFGKEYYKDELEEAIKDLKEVI